MACIAMGRCSFPSIACALDFGYVFRDKSVGLKRSTYRRSVWQGSLAFRLFCDFMFVPLRNIRDTKRRSSRDLVSTSARLQQQKKWLAKSDGDQEECVQEFDDLVQDGLLHWIAVRRKLAPDPDKPPVGYVAQVLRNKLTDLKRAHPAEKRAGDLGMVSLSATIDGSRTARQWPNPWLQPSSRNRRRAVMPANAICLLIHWAHWLT
jgi:hypothetical protein